MSFEQAKTVRDAKRHVRWMHGNADLRDLKGRRVDPMDPKRGFVVEWKE